MTDDMRGAGIPDTGPRARSLARFFADVSPRLLEDLGASGVLAGAERETAVREWHAVALHACIRGVVSDGGPSDEIADLVDAFHDLVLAGIAPGGEGPALRAHLAARYEEYDGITRTLGRDRAHEVPRAIAAASARHVRAGEPMALAETLATLLEALAEGAAASLAEGGAVEPGLPPFDPLRRLTARLDAAGISWAVGGSGLLASLALVDEVNDWDVQVEAEPEVLRALFADVPHSFHGHGGCHADWKLSFDAERTELIPRFAFFAPGGIVRVPLRVSRRWRDMPMASPEGWACAYWLMGRLDEPPLRVRRSVRAELLFDWLREHGADAACAREMLAEPLPEELAARLRTLAPAR